MTTLETLTDILEFLEQLQDVPTDDYQDGYQKGLEQACNILGAYIKYDGPF